VKMLISNSGPDRPGEYPGRSGGRVDGLIDEQSRVPRTKH
jgi:hypothetical protein